MENVFDINNFNIIQDEENYYFFRALNRADNTDLENGVITNNDGSFTKIRTDRERWEENEENPDPKYNKDSLLTLEQINDHIKMRYRKDTNCISLSSNTNVSIVYGRGSYTDKYVMVKIPKKEMGDKVVNAGEYMLSEIEKRVQEAIANISKEDGSDVLQMIDKIDGSKSMEELTNILLSTYKLNEESTMNYAGTKIKNVEKSSIQTRLGNYSALNEAQTLEKNKIFAKLTLLEQRKLMEPIIPHTANNSRLIATVGNAFSSSELIHYGDIPGEKITEVSKEFMDMLSLLQQEKEKNPDNAETISKMENEIITYINNGYKIVDRAGNLICTNGSTEIDLGSSSFLQSTNNTPQRISIKEAYDLTKGKLSYEDVDSKLQKLFYLSRSALQARGFANVLGNLINETSNNEYHEVIEEIRNTGFKIEPEVMNRQSGYQYKISESVAIGINPSEIGIIESVQKLQNEELERIIRTRWNN